MTTTVTLSDVASTVRDDLFAARLPILGTTLADTVAFVDEVAGRVETLAADIEAIVASIAPGAADRAQQIADAIDALDVLAAGDPGFIEAIVDQSGQVVMIYNETSALTPLAVTLDSDTDLGIGGLTTGGTLDIVGNVRASGRFQIDIDTGEAVAEIAGTGLFTANLTGTLNAGASAELGFLSVDLTDTRDASSPELQLNYSIGTDAGGNIQTALRGTAALSADIRFGGSDALPSIETGFDFATRFDADDLATRFEIDGDARLTFEDVRVDAGDIARFVKNTVGEVLDLLDTFPVGAVLDVLGVPLPVISQLAGSDVTLLTIARDVTNDPTLGALIEALDSLRAVGVAANDLAASGGFVDYGDITLDDLDDVINADLPTDISGIVENPFGVSQTPDPLGLLGGLGAALEDLSGVAGIGVDIPLLTDPLATVAELLLNGVSATPATIIEVDLPPLDFDVPYGLDFQFGPFILGIAGNVGTTIDAGFGYDTTGLISGNGFDDGFYFDAGGPLVTVRAAIEANAGVGVGGIASVRVAGGLLGTVGATLVDPDGDGRTRLGEITTQPFGSLSGEVAAFIDIVGEIGVGVFSYEKRFNIAEVTLLRFDIDLTSGSSALGGPRLETLAEGSPLTDADGDAGTGTLQLNVGGRASLRTVDPDLDDDGSGGKATAEIFRVTTAPRGAEDGEDGVFFGDELIVRGLGGYEVFERAAEYDLIVGDGGTRNDVLALDADIAVIAQLFGGQGNDELVGGALGDTLVGAEGNDSLVGNDGDDVLVGGAGRDTLDGGAGADTLVGGEDSDLVDYASATSAVFLVGDASSDGQRILGSGGAAGDVLTGFERIEGSDFGDRIEGFAAFANQIDGDGGDDTIIGGNVTDLLIGGAGADSLVGGLGAADDDDDWTTYSFSEDAVSVNLATGVNTGGDAEGDTLSGIENVQLTGFDDVFIGDGADNIVEGFAGNDRIAGGGGDDSLDGQAGDDALISTEGRDTVIGGLGDDLLVWSRVGSTRTIRFQATEDGSPTGFTGERTVVSGIESYDITTNAGDDDIITVGGDDTLDLGDGDDTAILGEGNNEVIAGAGADTVTSGSGDDTLDLGDGDDIATIAGGDNEVLSGAGRDVITTGGGDDTIEAGDGDDVVVSGFGRDLIELGFGDDDGRAAGGQDTILGDLGDDTLRVETDAIGGLTDAQERERDRDPVTTVDGGAGIDLFVLDGSRAGTALSTAFGSSSAGPGRVRYMITEDDEGEPFSGATFTDVIVTGIELVDVLGGDFDDTLNAQGREGVTGAERVLNATLRGGGGDDSLSGSNGADLLEGGFDDDFIDTAFGGQETVRGGEGDDVAYLSDDTDLFEGGGGNDQAWVRWGFQRPGFVSDGVLDGGAGADTLVAALGDVSNQAITGFETLLLTSALSNADLSIRTDQLNAFGDVNLRSTVGGSTVDFDLTLTTGGTATFNGLDLEADTAVAGQRLTIIASDDGNEIVFADTSGIADGARIAFRGGAGDDVFDLPDQADGLFQNRGVTLSGGDGNDLLTGGDGGDILIGDRVRFDSPASNDDTLDGAGGDDSILGGVGTDLLVGGVGDDTLDGGQSFDDTLRGGVGDDVLRVNGDAAVADGGVGDDLVFVRATLTQTLPDGTTYQGVSGVLEGGAGTDTIRLDFGDVSRAAITGFERAELTGRASLRADQAASLGDVLVGRADVPAATVLAVLTFTEGGAAAFGDVTMTNDSRFDLAANADGTVVTFGGESTVTDGQFVFRGGAGDDGFFGVGLSDDVINGAGGDDTLYGAGGDDTISGGQGADTVIFDAATVASGDASYQGSRGFQRLSLRTDEGTATVQGAETFVLRGAAQDGGDLTVAARQSARGYDLDVAAQDDAASVTEGGTQTAGFDVLANDLLLDEDLGENGVLDASDDARRVTSVNGQLVAFGQSVGIDGAFGTLTIGSDGQATYVLTTDTDTGRSDTFSYTVTDGEGPGAVADIVIDISADAGPGGGPDSDGDGVPDDRDNAIFVANPDQRDTDGDGYGNVVDADFNNDGLINALDLGLFTQEFGSFDPTLSLDQDLNGDGFVNTIDLGVLADTFGGAPGPSFVDFVV